MHKAIISLFVALVAITIENNVMAKYDDSCRIGVLSCQKDCNSRYKQNLDKNQCLLSCTFGGIRCLNSFENQ